jgi:hypothetical protein
MRPYSWVNLCRYRFCTLMEAAQGDILLRGSPTRGYELLDAVSHQPLAGWMALEDAIDVALSMTTGAVWQQCLDSDGNPTGPPVQLLCSANDPWRRSGV